MASWRDRYLGLPLLPHCHLLPVPLLDNPMRSPWKPSVKVSLLGKSTGWKKVLSGSGTANNICLKFLLHLICIIRFWGKYKRKHIVIFLFILVISFISSSLHPFLNCSENHLFFSFCIFQSSLYCLYYMFKCSNPSFYLNAVFLNVILCSFHEHRIPTSLTEDAN